PPPPALFNVMQDSSTPLIGMADKELRAYLGELHDSELPACAALALTMRLVHGRGARRTPHFYAMATILGQLIPESGLEPAAAYAGLCARPDAELRQRLADVWQKLYGVPMLPGQRV